MKLPQAKKIHFIAIGGIAVSAIAKLCHNRNIEITGSDINESIITKELEEKYNIPIYIGSRSENINNSIDMVIYSPAVPNTDLEYQKAQNLNIPLFSYSEIIGQLSLENITIAISGTNGKTTTTSMIVEVMKNQNLHPTVIIGGILQKYHSNFLVGDSPYFITEACEYKRSFLNIHHDILVITNITKDHLDYFKDFADIQSAFLSFIDNKKGFGKIICNTKLPGLQIIIDYAQKNNIKVIDYSKYLTDSYTVSLPGEHNRYNMAATLAVVETVGLNIKEAANYLEKGFSGTKRRMEHIGYTKDGAKIYDDYAHNPEGIEFLIHGLKKHYPKKKIIVLFEPHLYSRTEDFKEEFGRTLSLSDILYLFPIYKAREISQPDKDFLLKKFINKKNNFYLVKNQKNFKKEFEDRHYDDNHIIVTLGAGNIWKHGLSIKAD